MNKGLKSYTKHLNLNVGNVNIYTNLYSGDANFLFTLPLLTTVGYAPINIGLIFSKFRAALGEFGIGMRLNYNISIQSSGNKLRVTNSDFTVDEYEYSEENNEYRCKETDYVITRSGAFLMEDRQGNVIKLYENNKYPDEIRYSTGEIIYFNYNEETNDLIEIHNNNGDYLYFNKDIDSGMVETISWKKNEEELAHIYLIYENGYLIGAEISYSGTNYKQYSFEYGDSKYRISDDISKDKVEVDFYGLAAIKLTKQKKNSTYYNEVFIDRNGNRTIVRENGKETTYVFDMDGLLMFVKDDRNNIISYHYDKQTKKLLAANDASLVDGSSNLYDGQGNFSNIDESDEFYISLFVNNIKFCSQNQQIEVTGEFKKGDLVSLIMWVKQTGNSNIGIELSNYNETCHYVLEKRSLEEYFPVVCGIKLENNTEKLKVNINITEPIIIGKIELVKRAYGVYYSYQDWNLVRVDKNGCIEEYLYNEKNEMIENQLVTSKVVAYERNEKGYIVKSVNEYASAVNKGYDDKNKLSS